MGVLVRPVHHAPQFVPLVQAAEFNTIADTQWHAL